MKRSFLKSNWVCAPNSHPKYLVGSARCGKKFREINLTAGTFFYVKSLTSRGTSEGPGNISHVGNDGLDSVALALDLGLQPGHFVPVEGILNLSVNVERHFGLSLIFSFLIETVFLLSSFEAFQIR